MTASAPILDAHLHVWSDGAAPFPYTTGNEPPAELRKEATVEKLLGEMDKAGVQGALIVQPINHKFDHSYVTRCLTQHPTRFKGMCLLDPSGSAADAVAQLEALHGAGYVGVRFNPGLWPEGRGMDDEVGRAAYKRAGELGMVVGFMCFKGLDLHIEAVTALVEAQPTTKAVIDHFGFFRQDSQAREDIWKEVIGLAQYPHVHVKLSAFFRVSADPYPYQDLWPRVRELVDAFGSQRLLYGSDFPFVQQQCGYLKSSQALSVVRWGGEDSLLTAKEYQDVTRGTFEGLFGAFPE
eukprot:CAMPEP_0173386724 /NCGR_PEP_ID=MMETSP1356-20130122/9310_1 /TAXON_ID=77927 ORGANISM="Hemiselmis virescens, Strain PCC157" /NCGR_SAMPLE_ID=MMETSP1356 /ASSEMBLY_ACC=CAM_ASM_000847 /LENGTH=293 /DNA_ID=CAMNT_0014343067 /DNA_START=180 /DNA_END=1061 /DNA_ORIENTATION=+